jgi:cysteine-rich repeat protein
LHYYECDDGNLENGDGCSSTCTIETGYICIGGSNDHADMCLEFCGDGITIISVTGICDDGNIFNGDGCSSTCDVETGWKCKGGSLTTADSCWEVCGDGMNAGGLECDDDNIANGDGCSSTCSVEVGYNCTGGSLVVSDTCRELCGDGKNFGHYDCDDYNNKALLHKETIVI